VPLRHPRTYSGRCLPPARAAAQRRRRGTSSGWHYVGPLATTATSVPLATRSSSSSSNSSNSSSSSSSNSWGCRMQRVASHQRRARSAAAHHSATCSAAVVAECRPWSATDACAAARAQWRALPADQRGRQPVRVCRRHGLAVPAAAVATKAGWRHRRGAPAHDGDLWRQPRRHGRLDLT
jgi:hypothetical protein